MPFLPRDERVYFGNKFDAEQLITYMRKNKKRLPPFRFDCGKDDPLFASNQKLHKLLDQEGIPHTFEVFEGGHSNDYWTANIGNTLTYFNSLKINK